MYLSHNWLKDQLGILRNWQDVCRERWHPHTESRRNFTGEALNPRPNDKEAGMLSLPFIVLPCRWELEGGDHSFFAVGTGSVTDTTSMLNHSVPRVPWKIYEQVISIYYLPDFRDPKKQRLYFFFPSPIAHNPFVTFVNMGQRWQLKTQHDKADSPMTYCTKTSRHSQWNTYIY